MQPRRDRAVVVLGGMLLTGCRFDVSGVLAEVDSAPAAADSAVAADAPVPDAVGSADAAPADTGVFDAAPPVDSPGLIEAVSVVVAIDHGRLGNLTIKLASADGTTLGLMSRPGFFEAADDGSDNGTTVEYGPEGDQSDLWSSSPITFADDAVADAEAMGKDLYGADTAVCASDGVCAYFPNPDSVAGVTRLGDLAGEAVTGAWRLCVGDSAPGTGGTLQSWSVTLVSDLGTDTLSSGPIAAPIEDGAYSGTIVTMVCHTLIAP